MKEIIGILEEVQSKMLGIEARLQMIRPDPSSVADVQAIDDTLRTLEQYHQQVVKLENYLLTKRLEVTQAKLVAVQQESARPTQAEPSP